MSETITIPLGPDAQVVLEKLKNFPKDMLLAVARGLDRGLGSALGEISRTRFTGPGPYVPGLHRLGVGHGHRVNGVFVAGNRLRASLRWNATGLPGKGEGGEPSQIAGNTVTGSMGTNVKYFGVHEFGFSGEVQVRPHLRRNVSKRRFIDPSKKRGFSERKVRGADSEVRAYSRHMQMPERAPLRTGIEENRDRIGAAVTAEISKLWTPKP